MSTNSSYTPLPRESYLFSQWHWSERNDQHHDHIAARSPAYPACHNAISHARHEAGPKKPKCPPFRTGSHRYSKTMNVHQFDLDLRGAIPEVLGQSADARSASKNDYTGQGRISSGCQPSISSTDHDNIIHHRISPAGIGWWLNNSNARHALLQALSLGPLVPIARSHHYEINLGVL